MKWIVKMGNYKEQVIAIKDKDGDLIDNLADAEYIKFQVKESPKGDLLIEKTKDNGISVNTPQPGYLTLILTSQDTNIRPGIFRMALELKLPGDKIHETYLFVDGVETDLFEIKENLIKN